jgi:uncharacterized protein YdiU (UPF0061 family)
MHRRLIGRVHNILRLANYHRIIVKAKMCSGYCDDKKVTTLESLVFDNKALRHLPVDVNVDNRQRHVRAACYSRVIPSPISNPRLVVYSPSAMQLLDLSQTEIDRPEFVEYFSGNRLLPGSEPAAHCYCGHQFGYFAGQLGDGAAIYLGEILNNSGERWEVQLKGAGKTPYSRTADGRKVLRSSIREFLCSEAMFHLGVPTTRAGCCLTSDSTVVRDIFYSGNPRHENCAIIARIAQSFIRFGSFEICKSPDPETGHGGPSFGQPEVLKQLADYVLTNFYSQVSNQCNANRPENAYIDLFKEIVRRTASLVAQWQCLGFCHGVLNTDNMSILGLTIDYGPFGFLDRYDPDHVSNASDDGGRYAFSKQPEICKWNCLKLAEALSLLAPLDKLLLELHYYDQVFQQCYLDGMCRKLGLLSVRLDTDSELVESLLDTMCNSGADFTNTFRCLSDLPIPTSHSNVDHDLSRVKGYILQQCATIEELEMAYAARVDTRQLAMFRSLLESNPQMLQNLGKGFRQVVNEIERHKKLQQIKQMTPSRKQQLDNELWDRWLTRYVQRLQVEVTDSSDAYALNTKRRTVMNSTNPKFILRNYIAQQAIEAAENDDFTEVQHTLQLLQHPYGDDEDLTVAKDLAFSQNAETSHDTNYSGPESSLTHVSKYTCKPPSWSTQLRVT